MTLPCDAVVVVVMPRIIRPRSGHPLTSFGAMISAMRADRLVATLLFLQSRGRVTASEVADELEVSIRTARRDLEALSIAGIPVYSQAGPGRRLVARRGRPHRPERAHRRRGPHPLPGRRAVVGGHARGEGRAAQARAGPARDVPGRGREGGVGHRPRPGPLGRHARRPPRRTSRCSSRRCCRRCRCVLGYRDRAGAVTERIVHPLGLVSKGSAWYLVADTDNGHAHVPRVAGAVGRAHRPAGASPARLRPGHDVAEGGRRDGRAARLGPGARARRPDDPRTAPRPLRQPARGGRAHRRTAGSTIDIGFAEDHDPVDGARRVRRGPRGARAARGARPASARSARSSSIGTAPPDRARGRRGQAEQASQVPIRSRRCAVERNPVPDTALASADSRLCSSCRRHGEVVDPAALGADEVVVVADEILGQLEAGVLARRDDPVHHAHLLEHVEVAVGRALAQPGRRVDQLGDRDRPGRGHERLDQPPPAARVALVDEPEPVRHHLVDRGRAQGGHRGDVTSANENERFSHMGCGFLVAEGTGVGTEGHAPHPARRVPPRRGAARSVDRHRHCHGLRGTVERDRDARARPVPRRERVGHRPGHRDRHLRPRPDRGGRRARCAASA